MSIITEAGGFAEAANVPVLLDAAAAAKLLGMGRRSFYRAVQRGEIPAPRLGYRRRCRRWSLAELTAWARGQIERPARETRAALIRLVTLP